MSKNYELKIKAVDKPKEYYIASRMDWDTASQLLGGQAMRINTGATKMLKSAMKAKGINKNKHGKRMYFYSCPDHINTEEQLLEFIDEKNDMMNKLAYGKVMNVLAWFCQEDFGKMLHETNKGWTDRDEAGRMNKQQMKGYLNMFVEKMAPLITLTYQLDRPNSTV